MSPALKDRGSPSLAQSMPLWAHSAGEDSYTLLGQDRIELCEIPHVQHQPFKHSVWCTQNTTTLPTTLPFPCKNGPMLCSWKSVKRQPKVWSPRDQQPPGKVDLRDCVCSPSFSQAAKRTLDFGGCQFGVMHSTGSFAPKANSWSSWWLPRTGTATLQCSGYHDAQDLLWVCFPQTETSLPLSC